MTFEEELGEAFDEVASVAMPVQVRISGETYSGVVQAPPSDTPLREPGYEGQDQVVVMIPLVQFSQAPDDTKREVVEILSGPRIGKWILTSVNTDAAFYSLTCRPAD